MHQDIVLLLLLYLGYSTITTTRQEARLLPWSDPPLRGGREQRLELVPAQRRPGGAVILAGTWF